MTKKLKIRFVKFEKALVGQQLSVSGRKFFAQSESVLFLSSRFDFAECAVWISLSPARFTTGIATKYFDTNEKRDEYLNKVIKWISIEQFAQSKPKIDGDVYTWEMEVADER